MYKYSTILFLLLPFITFSQKYDDYIGAGHNRDIKVISSSEKSDYPTLFTAKAQNTINGKGLDGKLMEASRFLTQATLGPDMNTIEKVAEIGIEAWLEEQFNIKEDNYLDITRDIFEITNNWRLNHGEDSSDISEFATWESFMYAWWEKNLFNDDLVRQRVAFALSEIFVISIESDLSAHGEGLASYYDILSDNAFGNLKDILMQITYHPTMAFYLTHLNNPKTNVEEGVHPDENYAREIMQLFTIGLYELNNDGTRKLDNNGNPIPTYNNSDIKEFAKVFTGLGAGAIRPNEWVDEPDFGYGLWVIDATVPLKMYEFQHEPGKKHLLNGYTIPEGNSGDEDIELAIEHLFNHPNVGPFICKQLIQRLIKSNPTPEYIDRVATIFNDNGEGVRGDLKAVVRAILLDEEARDCFWIDHESNGRLREPFLRFTNIARAVDKDQVHGHFWDIGWRYYQETGQMVLFSPSVFNFFLPYFQPNGDISDAGMVAPEFQIHNSRTSFGYINRVFRWTIWADLLSNWLPEDPGVTTDFFNYEPMGKDPEVLINYMDIIFTYGMMTDRTRRIIRDNANSLIIDDYKRNRARLCFYLMMNSPDYNISK